MDHMSKYTPGFMVSSFTSCYLSKKYRTNKLVQQHKRKMGKNTLNTENEEKVCCFPEQDINSNMAPGQKLVTMDNVKKHQRYLHESLYSVHKQCNNISSSFAISQTADCLQLQFDTAGEWFKVTLQHRSLNNGWQ